MQVNLCRFAPAGYVHARALDEVVDAYEAGVLALGGSVARLDNAIGAQGKNLIFGAHLLSESLVRQIPDSAVICNFEQMDEQSRWTQGAPWMSLLSRCEVWDYSERNAAGLKKLVTAPDVKVVPVGYVPEWTRIDSAPVQDIDVLFYGSVNDRRKAVLADLKAAGLDVMAVFGVYGAERDALIARSKVVLNLHFYELGVFEVVRVAYLLANRKAVVSEVRDLSDVPPALRTAFLPTDYSMLADACRFLVVEADARRRLEALALKGVERLPMVSGLRDALGMPGVNWQGRE